MSTEQRRVEYGCKAPSLFRNVYAVQVNRVSACNGVIYDWLCLERGAWLFQALEGVLDRLASLLGFPKAFAARIPRFH